MSDTPRARPSRPHEDVGTPLAPTELQLALFRIVEDVQDVTEAIAVLLVDHGGALVAVSGDEADVPPALRSVLSASKLAEAGSVRALLEDVDLSGSPVNVSVFAVGLTHVLAVLFDAEADLVTVQQVGGEARDMIAELIAI